MRSLFIFLAVVVFLAGFACAQTPFTVVSGSIVEVVPWPVVSTIDLSAPSSLAAGPVRGTLSLDTSVAMPRMSPDLALATYQKRAEQQRAQLSAYSASTLIRAELPDTEQSGEYELERHYVAPRTLEFKAVRFSGDKFVKTGVINHLLQSEVDHLQKDDLSLTALTPANYKFSYKGGSDVDGHVVHVFQVKPRKQRAGLFKGRVYLDAYNGSLVRVEGSVVKSPSFFVKNVEFVQDYTDVSGFTFPAHVHSEARARIVGRAVVDIYQRNYQPIASPVQARQQIPTM